MKRKASDLSEKEKDDLLQLYYFKQVQLNDLVDIFKLTYYSVSKIISDDIKKRQSKKDDECE